MDSSILKRNPSYIHYLGTFLELTVGNNSHWLLCWRASLHGWDVRQFHTRCDGKRDTVTIVRKGKYVFGGYTDIPWGKKIALSFYHRHKKQRNVELMVLEWTRFSATPTSLLLISKMTKTSQYSKSWISNSFLSFLIFFSFDISVFIFKLRLIFLVLSSITNTFMLIWFRLIWFPQFPTPRCVGPKWFTPCRNFIFCCFLNYHFKLNRSPVIQGTLAENSPVGACFEYWLTSLKK